MIRNMYAVKDDLQGFMAPVADINDEVAVRNFAYMIQNSKEMIANAYDFSLYRVGTFDTDTAYLDAVLPVVFLCRGSDFVASEKGGVDG